MFIGAMYSKEVGEWVANIQVEPFFDRNKNKWTVVVDVAWRPPFEETQQDIRILEYDSESEARSIHVGSRIGSRTCVGWY